MVQCRHRKRTPQDTKRKGYNNEKITFKRVYYGFNPCYECSNGLIIEPGKKWADEYRYYVDDNGFNSLKEAKVYCIEQGQTIEQKQGEV